MERDFHFAVRPVVDITGPGFPTKTQHPLLGRHQQQNAAIAVTALEVSQRHSCHPYLDRQAISTGIARTVWPGRLEIISRNPTIVLDGAHNPAGALSLRDAMSVVPRKRLVCVYGILGDKSFEEATSYITPMCDKMVLTLHDTPRA